jgi:hypothetical protein
MLRLKLALYGSLLGVGLLYGAALGLPVWT